MMVVCWLKKEKYTESERERMDGGRKEGRKDAITSIRLNKQESIHHSTPPNPYLHPWNQTQPFLRVVGKNDFSTSGKEE